MTTKHIASTVSALRALSVGNRQTGSPVHVTGYYAAGDKEAVIYIYDSQSSATDNGGSVIAPNSGGGRWLLVKDITSVRDFGAKGDDSTDDLAAIQAAIDDHRGDIYFPPGIYRYSEPLEIGAGFGGTKIYGAGATQTVLKPQGCDGFLLDGNGYYRTQFSDFRLAGSSYASYSAFGLLPSTVTHVVGGCIWSRLTISGFLHGWTMKNAQINVFEDIGVTLNDEDGAVFNIIPDSESGQICACNRSHRLAVGGLGTVVKCTLPTSSERATQLIFDECDIQLSGEVVPFHVVDAHWQITNCEFENSEASCLIHLEATGSSLAPDETIITNNILVGGNSKIRVSRAEGAAQTPYRGWIVGNATGSGVFLDLEAGIDFVVGPHNGTINNTGGRYLTQIGGRNNQGRIRLANRAGITDDVGSTVTEMEAERVILASLPTTDPGVLGQVWSQDGTLKVSAGA